MWTIAGVVMDIKIHAAREDLSFHYRMILYTEVLAALGNEIRRQKDTSIHKMKTLFSYCT